MKGLLLISALIQAEAASTFAARPPAPNREHRAFWCHGYGVPGMTWDEAIGILSENGFTAVFPMMVWGNHAYYRSKVLPMQACVKDRGDQIVACLAACKKHGIECHVWKANFNCGNSRLFTEESEHLARTQVRFDGKRIDWLCPSHPENQKLEIDAMVEMATRYDVDGIHFDYIRYPGAHCCFCNGCRARFEEAIGQKVAGWPNSLRRRGSKHGQAWLDFRRRQITAVVAGVAKVVRQSKPKVKISAAVFSNWETCRDSVGQDWKLWCEKGYLDFVCPMNYFSDNARFEEMVNRQLEWAGQVPCYPGIGLSQWRPAYDFAKLVEQIRITRRLATGGFTVLIYTPTAARKIVPLCGKEITSRRAIRK